MRSCEVLLRCLVVSREAKAGKSFFPKSIAMLSTRIYHRILAAHRISCDAAYPITCSIRLLCEPLFLVNSLTLDQNASFSLFASHNVSSHESLMLPRLINYTNKIS
jgi:hypothetical protein